MLLSVVDMSSTQLCEGANSGLSTGLPKNRRFPRNAKARAYATIHRLNNGPEKSFKSRLSHLNCSLKEGIGVHKVLLDQQKCTDYNKDYFIKPTVQSHERTLKGIILKNYYNKNMNEEEYRRCAYDGARERRAEVERRSIPAILREQSKCFNMGASCSKDLEPAPSKKSNV